MSTPPRSPFGRGVPIPLSKNMAESGDCSMEGRSTEIRIQTALPGGVPSQPESQGLMLGLPAGDYLATAGGGGSILGREKGRGDRQINFPRFLSPSFPSSEKLGDWKPVIDRTPLSDYLETSRFKVESLVSVVYSLREEGFTVSTGLQNAYCRTPAHSSGRKYARFHLGGQTFHCRSPIFCFNHCLSDVQESVRMVIKVGPHPGQQTTWISGRLAENCNRQRTVQVAIGKPSSLFEYSGGGVMSMKASMKVANVSRPGSPVSVKRRGANLLKLLSHKGPVFFVSSERIYFCPIQPS